MMHAVSHALTHTHTHTHTFTHTHTDTHTRVTHRGRQGTGRGSCGIASGRRSTHNTHGESTARERAGDTSTHAGARAHTQAHRAHRRGEELQVGLLTCSEWKLPLCCDCTSCKCYYRCCCCCCGVRRGSGNCRHSQRQGGITCQGHSR